jgi:proteic killer suppression protein
MLSQRGCQTQTRNHLEARAGNRAEQHSIRVNDQCRLCFVWRDGDAYDVEIVDYRGG